MTKTFTTADVCDLAHELTVRECDRKGIEVDYNGDEEVYSDEAQVIFDTFFDDIEDIYENVYKWKNERDL